MQVGGRTRWISRMAAPVGREGFGMVVMASVLCSWGEGLDFWLVEKIVASTCHGYSAVAAVALFLFKRLAAGGFLLHTPERPNDSSCSHTARNNAVCVVAPNAIVVATQNARVAVAVAAANVVSHVGQPSAHVLNFRNVLVVVVVA
ncbi:hypothetical protein Tco_0052099 [Tanacetum coccineum]